MEQPSWFRHGGRETRCGTLRGGLPGWRLEAQDSDATEGAGTVTCPRRGDHGRRAFQTKRGAGGPTKTTGRVQSERMRPETKGGTSKSRGGRFQGDHQATAGAKGVRVGSCTRGRGRVRKGGSGRAGPGVTAAQPGLGTGKAGLLALRRWRDLGAGGDGDRR